VVPFVVLFTKTETPGIGEPSALDVTVPVIVCAITEALTSMSNKMSLGKRFFILFGFVNRSLSRNKLPENFISLT
jgi:hypothetical protein